MNVESMAAAGAPVAPHGGTGVKAAGGVAVLPLAPSRSKAGITTPTATFSSSRKKKKTVVMNPLLLKACRATSTARLTHGQLALNSLMFNETYYCVNELGRGSFARVVSAVHTPSGQKCAIKVIPRDKLRSKDNLRALTREIGLLSRLEHPNIVRLLDLVETPDTIFLVLEMANGELVKQIRHRMQKMDHRSYHALVRHFMRQLLRAVGYIHSKGVVHRDLKPENILLDEYNNVKLIDFGLGNSCGAGGGGSDGNFLTTYCGSPAYAAPELVSRKPYEGPPVDMWALGVVFYILMTGSIPFSRNNFVDLYRDIKTANYHVDPRVWPPWALSLLERLLCVSPSQRGTVSELLEHPWLRTDGSSHPHPLQSVCVPVRSPSQINSECVEVCVRYGFDRKELLDSLLGRKRNSATAMYFLTAVARLRKILQRAKEQRRQARAAAQQQQLLQHPSPSNSNSHNGSSPSISASPTTSANAVSPMTNAISPLASPVVVKGGVGGGKAPPRGGSTPQPVQLPQKHPRAFTREDPGAISTPGVASPAAAGGSGTGGNTPEGNGGNTPVALSPNPSVFHKASKMRRSNPPMVIGNSEASSSMVFQQAQVPQKRPGPMRRTSTTGLVGSSTVAKSSTRNPHPLSPPVFQSPVRNRRLRKSRGTPSGSYGSEAGDTSPLGLGAGCISPPSHEALRSALSAALPPVNIPASRSPGVGVPRVGKVGSRVSTSRGRGTVNTSVSMARMGSIAHVSTGSRGSPSPILHHHQHLCQATTNTRSGMLLRSESRGARVPPSTPGAPIAFGGSGEQSSQFLPPLETTPSTPLAGGGGALPFPSSHSSSMGPSSSVYSGQSTRSTTPVGGRGNRGGATLTPVASNASVSSIMASVSGEPGAIVRNSSYGAAASPLGVSSSSGAHFALSGRASTTLSDLVVSPSGGPSSALSSTSSMGAGPETSLGGHRNRGVVTRRSICVPLALSPTTGIMAAPGGAVAAGITPGHHHAPNHPIRRASAHPTGLPSALPAVRRTGGDCGDLSASSHPVSIVPGNSNFNSNLRQVKDTDFSVDVVSGPHATQMDADARGRAVVATLNTVLVALGLRFTHPTPGHFSLLLDPACSLEPPKVSQVPQKASSTHVLKVGGRGTAVHAPNRGFPSWRRVLSAVEDLVADSELSAPIDPQGSDAAARVLRMNVDVAVRVSKGGSLGIHFHRICGDPLLADAISSCIVEGLRAHVIAG